MILQTNKNYFMSATLLLLQSRLNNLNRKVYVMSSDTVNAMLNTLNKKDLQ